jgi:hypothetical protein
MKVAVIIAHTASGWKLLSVGDDISALKQSFKDMKIAGQHAIGEEAADVAVYLDTGGNVRRKRLNSADETKRVDAANHKVATDAAAAQRARAEQQAAASGRAQATEIAQKAVAVVAAEVARIAGAEAPGDAPLAATKPAPAAVSPGTAKAPAPAAPAAPAPATAAAVAIESDEDSGDAAERFGGKKPKAKN